MTVLMPVYNAGAYLRPAVESVLSQTFGDFELLVVDDHSGDDSIAVLESYGDRRIRILRNERNLGQVASLNRGLAEAQGKYVARLDQDDVCLPERLARQVAMLDAEPAVALVATWMDVLDDEGRPLWQLRETIRDFPGFVYAILTDDLPIAHPTVMFRRDVVRGLGGYDTSVVLAEDRDLWRRLALARHGARVIEEPLVLYRQHPGQQSQRRRREQLASNLAALERFLTSLEPDAPARLLRLLLTWDYAFWDACRSRQDAIGVERGLERLLAAARETLQLSGSETAALDRLVRDRVGVAARRSWRKGVVRHWRASPRLTRFARGGLPPLRGALRAAEYALVYVLAPALAAIYRAERLGEALRARRRAQPQVRTPIPPH